MTDRYYPSSEPKPQHFPDSVSESKQVLQAM